MKLTYVLTTVALTCPLVCQAAPRGPRDGGGATGAVCFKNPYIVDEIHRYNKSEDRSNPVILPAKVMSSSFDLFKQIDSVELLDLLEEKSIKKDHKNYKQVQMKAGETEMEFVERILGRFEVTLPRFYQELMWAKENLTFDEPSEEPNGISPIPDVAQVGLIDTTKCVYSTIAYQEGEPDQYNRLHTDERIFNLPETVFAKNHRAATYLHEIVYKFLRKNYGVKDSRKARIFVSTFMREDLDVVQIRKMFKLANLSVESIGFNEPNSQNILRFWPYSSSIYLVAPKYGLNLLLSDAVKDIKQHIEEWDYRGELSDVSISREFQSYVDTLMVGKPKSQMNSEDYDNIAKEALQMVITRLNKNVELRIRSRFMNKWAQKLLKFTGVENAQPELHRVFDKMLKVELRLQAEQTNGAWGVVNHYISWHGIIARDQLDQVRVSAEVISPDLSEELAALEKIYSKITFPVAQ